MKTVVLTDRERQKARGWLLIMEEQCRQNNKAWEADILKSICRKLRKKDLSVQGKLVKPNVP